MGKTDEKIQKRNRRHKRIRAKVSGTKALPRMALFKSNRYIYCQLIDDENSNTLIEASSGGKTAKSNTTMKQSRETGKALAKKALEKKISKVVFDRGGFLYAGKVKEFAEGAREGGLIF